MKMFYRVFSLVLALMLCVSLLPMSAMALEVPDMDVLQSVVDAVAESGETDDADVSEVVEEVIAENVDVTEEADTLAASTLVAIDETNFPDDNFRAYVSEELDDDGDGYVPFYEVENEWGIYCDGRDIESLKGIELFSNLRYLYCADNNLSFLDIASLKYLEGLYCANNNLSSLDMTSLENLEYLSCDEEAIGGINLTATEDGYTADLSAISHLLDSEWEIGAGADEWSPTIASVYDAETGMATFAMRPKVIMFGEEVKWEYEGDEGEYWDAHITIYVSDADLPKLAAPTDLQWGIEYSGEWDEETQSVIEVPKEHPGMMSWLNAENPGLGWYDLSIDIYGDTGDGFESKGGMSTSLNGDYTYGYWTATRFIEVDPETGDYYFTVQYIGDGQTCGDSEVAKSEVYHYTKPEAVLDSCGTPVWTEDGKITWDEPENVEFVDYYDITIWYSDTADGEFQSGYGSMSETNEFDSTNFNWVIEREGSAYYAISVRAISKDITQICNSEWTERSEARYFSGEASEDLPVGDMDGDGYVLANDLVSLMKSLVSGEVDAATNPDINEDGSIDVLDVIRLIRIMAGLV